MPEVIEYEGVSSLFHRDRTMFQDDALIEIKTFHDEANRLPGLT